MGEALGLSGEEVVILEGCDSGFLGNRVSGGGSRPANDLRPFLLDG